MKKETKKKTDTLRKTVPPNDRKTHAENREKTRERASHEFKTLTGEHIRYTAPALWEI